MEPVPSADELLTAASEEAGLGDFGDDRFLTGLRQYVWSLNAEAKLGLVGPAVAAAELQQLLVNKLRFEADLRRHPEILDEDVSRPLFILGLMRTGTTKLQQIIAEDPSVLSLPLWRTCNLAPIPGADPRSPDPRVAIGEELARQVAQSAPELMAAHPAEATAPEEEAFIMRLSFESVANGMFSWVPSYLEWQSEQDQRFTYEYLRTMLQYVQWQDGGGRGRSWVLKTPMHLPCIDVLLDVFPDATVVHAHRDPRTAIASTLRTYEVLWRSRDNNVGLAEVRTFAGLWAEHMQTYLSKRAALGQAEIVDVEYAEIVSNPLRVVHRVFHAWAKQLTPRAENLMKAFDREKNQHRYGKHEYTLKRYGLTGDEVDEMFADYLGSFNVMRSRTT